MEVIIYAVIGYIILYFIIKSAVRNGILEARAKPAGSKGIVKVLNESSTSEDDVDEGGDRISQAICPSCGAEHDIDFPACPHCGHRYGQ